MADGTWPGLPLAQKDTFNTALYMCYGYYPIPTIYSEPWSESQKRAMYIFTVESVVPCLEAEGLIVEKMPTVETFVDTFDTRPWYPYEQIDTSSMTQSQIDDLNSRCPQTPPLKLLQDSSP